MRTPVGVHVARVRGVVSHRERQQMFVAVGGRLHDRRSVRRLVPTLRQPHRWLRSQIPQPVRVAGAPSGRDEEQTFLVPVNNTTGVVRSRRPTPPAPITATVVPGSTPAVLSVRRAIGASTECARSHRESVSACALGGWGHAVFLPAAASRLPSSQSVGARPGRKRSTVQPLSNGVKNATSIFVWCINQRPSTRLYWS